MTRSLAILLRFVGIAALLYSGLGFLGVVFALMGISWAATADAETMRSGLAMVTAQSHEMVSSVCVALPKVSPAPRGTTSSSTSCPDSARRNP